MGLETIDPRDITTVLPRQEPLRMETTPSLAMRASQLETPNPAMESGERVGKIEGMAIAFQAAVHL